MIITIAFNVRNTVKTMENWPINIGHTKFFLECEGHTIKRVCISFSDISTEFAPTLSSEPNQPYTHKVKVNSGHYAALAIKRILNWQSVISGQQIFDLDLDGYELRFSPESINEESKIQIRSFSSSYDNSINSECSFEEIGKAFCVGQVEETRIESTSHFRDGRLAFFAGRYIDSFNNMFLFLETRYCDGKTKSAQQVSLLSKNETICKSLEKTVTELRTEPCSTSKHLEKIFDVKYDTKDKIKTLVLLRGKLRHHSLKSPSRWDPNKQNEFKSPAMFLNT